MPALRTYRTLYPSRISSIPLGIVLVLFFHLTASSQVFRNLNLEQICTDSKTGLCSWGLSWGGKNAVSPDSRGGVRSLRIEGSVENSVGFAEQSASTSGDGGLRIVTLTARVRSANVSGKGAGLNIGLYDKDNSLVSTKDMGGFYSLDWVRGHSDWKDYTVSIVCPQEVSTVRIGAILYGKGTAWFSDFRVTVAPVADRKPSRLAYSYVTEAARLIRRHSLVAGSADMAKVESTALKIAGPAKGYKDCYLAVEFMLESLRPLGDEHSFLMKAAEVRNWKNGGSQVRKIEDPEARQIDEFGYILVPPFHSGDKRQILKYADRLQQSIADLSRSRVKGWIVDLRKNTGGNMAPMVAGLGPLFSSTKLGSLIDVRGRPNSWYYKNGQYYWDDDPGWRVTTPAKVDSRLPIAVLIGNQTGSSGEAVLVSFLKNERTKTFGCPTWGLTTGNSDFTLADGAQIYVAATVMADRQGNQYRSKIIPDISVEKCTEGDVLERATKWLREQQ